MVQTPMRSLIDI